MTAKQKNWIDVNDIDDQSDWGIKRPIVNKLKRLSLACRKYFLFIDFEYFNFYSNRKRYISYLIYCEIIDGKLNIY